MSTSGTVPIRTMLEQYNYAFACITNALIAKSLIADTWKFFQQGLLDDQYDNIARTAPKLKKNVLYKTFSHIGSGEGQKNIGEALMRCLY